MYNLFWNFLKIVIEHNEKKHINLRQTLCYCQTAHNLTVIFNNYNSYFSLRFGLVNSIYN